jgi:hypothetical protein
VRGAKICYRFDFINHDGSVDQHDLGQVADDAAARNRASDALRVSQTATAVDVWRNTDHLGRIRRSAAMAQRAPWGFCRPTVMPPPPTA